jgi:uncharacterized protein YndB with AHSA1/START domain
MATTVLDEELRTIHVIKEIEIAAPLETTFRALLEELGPAGQMPDGKAFPMVVEPWPGGRWYRDLGDKAGHFWGHVQVIKPPTLLEVTGPFFMSFSASNHLQYRLTEEGDGTRLKLTHRAFGPIPQAVCDGVTKGWDHKLNRVREIAEGPKGEPRKKAER